MILALESKVTTLKSGQIPIPNTLPNRLCVILIRICIQSVPNSPASLTDILNDWKKSVEGQWSSGREEWETKVKSVETNLGTTTAKFDAAASITTESCSGMGIF
jgi:hypothetical protein